MDDFWFSGDGTTTLKLQVLPFVLAKNLNANSFGNFGGNSIRLYTEKLAGGVKGCIGVVKDALPEHGVPNPLLNEDIRKISKNQMRIIDIYRKNISEEESREIVYKAKKIEWYKIVYPAFLEQGFVHKEGLTDGLEK